MQLIQGNLSPIVLGNCKERKIHRRLNDDLVTRLGERMHRDVERGDDAGAVREPIALDVPPMPPAHPIDHRFKVRIRAHGVAIDPVLRALLNCIDDGGRCLKVHIRHPHGQNVFAEFTPLVRIRVATINHIIKI